MENDNIKEGYIVDYISGLEVKISPEEIQAVQVFAKQLVEDYGYPKSYIQTRPQWRVKIRPSDTKKEYPIDIAVFSKEEKNDETFFIVVECKKRDRKDGISQLQDYLRFSKAELGVWFNGAERQFIKKIEKNGKILFEEIPNIPRYGQRIEDIGLFKRSELGNAHNLKLIFNAIRNHLAGNTVGTTRDEELARQLINLIFCKIFDERFTPQDEIVSFRAGVNEEPVVVKNRINELFEKVKGKYSEVIDLSEKIALDPKSIVYIVGELQNYCLIDAERDVIADAFEVFISGALKGGQGQFFTPRNVIQLMVEIIKPQEDELVIDPACGSGGFLVETLRYKWKEVEEKGKKLKWSEKAITEDKMATAIKSIRGIEKDDFLSKVAKAYMAILGDGKGGIFCEDSLDKPENWDARTQQQIGFGKFDIVLTNPPFGKDIKITGNEKLSQFELAHQWDKEGDNYVKTSKLKKEGKPDVLFIERCLQLLKDGGRMGIVLSETFFHAPKAKYVVEFIKRNNITCVVDLPHNTFRPNNNAKCLVLFLEKNIRQQEKILFAVAEEMGHDHQGKIIYHWDTEKREVDKGNIWDDIKTIIEEVRAKEHKKYTFEEDSKKVLSIGVLVPRYYWQKKDKEVEKLAKQQNCVLITISQLIKEGIIKAFDGHGSPASENKGMGEIPYIRVKDIVNWELYKDPTALIPEQVYLEMKGSKELKVGDIAYVRRGSYRIGSVAMVSPFDIKVLTTREILFLRVIKENNKYDISPYYLLYLLSGNLVQMQTFNKVLIETTLPNIGNRWKELKLPISTKPAERKKIAERIKYVVDKKWDAIEEINRIKKDFGNLLT
jgi:type I restriction enzyme M protein